MLYSQPIKNRSEGFYLYFQNAKIYTLFRIDHIHIQTLTKI